MLHAGSGWGIGIIIRLGSSSKQTCSQGKAKVLKGTQTIVSCLFYADKLKPYASVTYNLVILCFFVLHNVETMHTQMSQLSKLNVITVQAVGKKNVT